MSFPASPAEIPGWDIVYSELPVPVKARPGEVVVRIPLYENRTFRAENQYNPYVYGVVVQDSTGGLRIATGGEVDVLVDKSADSIKAGDWLVTSGSTGRIMRAGADWPVRPTVLGAALTDWFPEDSLATVKVLLTPGERVSIPGADYKD